MENEKVDRNERIGEVLLAMDDRIKKLADRVDEMEARRHEAINKAMQAYDGEIAKVVLDLAKAQRIKQDIVANMERDSKVDMVKRCEESSQPKPTHGGFAGGVGILYGNIKIPAVVVKVVESWVSAKFGRFTRAEASAAIREKFPAQVKGKNGNVVQYITEESFAKLKNDDIAVLGETDMAHPLEKGESA